MVNLSEQQDPSEFIYHIKKHFLCLSDHILYPIICTKRLFLKIKNNQENQEYIYKYNIERRETHMLSIPIVPGCSLSEMIKRYQEKLVQKEPSVDIDWKNVSLCEEDELPPFVKEKQKHIDPVIEGYGKGTQKDYIKQTVFELPDILYIRLGRNSGIFKINDPIHEAMHITIHPDPNQKRTVSFDLNGFIPHNGTGVNSGHYIAYVKREGKWYKTDDTVTTEVDKSSAEAASQQAYLLFYTKQ